MNDWIYGWAMVMTVLAVGAVFVCWGVLRGHQGEFAPHEQMRRSTPWPPPSLPAQTVDVTYRKPELLALPRGDR